MVAPKPVGPRATEAGELQRDHVVAAAEWLRERVPDRRGLGHSVDEDGRHGDSFVAVSVDQVAVEEAAGGAAEEQRHRVVVEWKRRGLR